MKEKLLVIELDESTSVPRIFYKGEELTGKQEVKFDWNTWGFESADFLIKHYSTNGKDLGVSEIKGQCDASNNDDNDDDKNAGLFEAFKLANKLSLDEANDVINDTANQMLLKRFDDIEEQLRVLTEEYDLLNRYVYSADDDIEYR